MTSGRTKRIMSRKTVYVFSSSAEGHSSLHLCRPNRRKGIKVKKGQVKPYNLLSSPVFLIGWRTLTKAIGSMQVTLETQTMTMIL